MGIVERLFFAIAVAFALPGVAAVMGAWVAAKMAAGWHLEKGETPDERKMLKKRRFAALRGNLVSMACATVGGLIARGTIRW